MVQLRVTPFADNQASRCDVGRNETLVSLAESQPQYATILTGNHEPLCGPAVNHGSKLLYSKA
jgi:hypothetical protein